VKRCLNASICQLEQCSLCRLKVKDYANTSPFSRETVPRRSCFYVERMATEAVNPKCSPMSVHCRAAQQSSIVGILQDSRRTFSSWATVDNERRLSYMPLVRKSWSRFRDEINDNCMPRVQSIESCKKLVVCLTSTAATRTQSAELRRVWTIFSTGRGSKIKFYHVTWYVDFHPTPWNRADC